MRKEQIEINNRIDLGATISFSQKDESFTFLRYNKN